jgi:hypothetical protein
MEMTALLYAAERDPEYVQLFIDAKADVNA